MFAIKVFAAMAAMTSMTVYGTESHPTRPRQSEPEVGAKRYWTPMDSIAWRTFDVGPLFSPDRTMFSFVTSRGDARCDCYHSTLSIFRSLDVRRALRSHSSNDFEPQPIRTISIDSMYGLTHVDWDTSGKSISFIASDPEGFDQYYEAEVDSGHVRQLTHWTEFVTSPAKRGTTVIGNLIRQGNPRRSSYPSSVVTRADFLNAFYTKNNHVVTYVTHNDRVWHLKTNYNPFFANSNMNDDGTLFSVVRRLGKVPASWGGYELASNVRIADSSFIVVDVERQTEEPVIAAPIGAVTSMGMRALRRGVSEAIWAPNDDWIVLTNSCIPLTAEAPSSASRSAFVVAVNRKTKAFQALEPVETANASGPPTLVTQVSWDSSANALVIAHHTNGKPSEVSAYVLSGATWTRVAAPSRSQVVQSKPFGFEISLRQSANEPPLLFAVRNGNEVPLISRDEVLDGVNRLPVKTYLWRSASGEMERGGLLLPSRLQSGPIPLVIQIYKYDPQLFAPDGMGQHAYAAQALAARGFAVLNIDLPNPSISDERELTLTKARVMSAIDALVRERVVDRNRVGLVGFSRAGFNVSYIVSHPGPNPIRAAVIDDALPGTYSDYLLKPLFGASVEGAQNSYGGSFWQNKQQWLRDEISFNADKVATPTMFTVHSNESIFQIAPTLGALALNGRPFELTSYGNAQHELVRVKQRLASYWLTIDWMDFWVRGVERPEANPDQYARWTAIRSAWRRRSAKEAGTSSRLPSQ